VVTFASSDTSIQTYPYLQTLLSNKKEVTNKIIDLELKTAIFSLLYGSRSREPQMMKKIEE